MIWQWLVESRRSPLRPLASDIPHPPKRKTPPAPVLQRLQAPTALPVTQPAVKAPIVATAPVTIAAEPAIVPSLPVTEPTVAAAPVAKALPAIDAAVAALPALPIGATAAATAPETPAETESDTHAPLLTVAANLTTVELPTLTPPTPELTASLQSPFAATGNGSQPVPADVMAILQSPFAITASGNQPLPADVVAALPSPFEVTGNGQQALPTDVLAMLVSPADLTASVAPGPPAASTDDETAAMTAFARDLADLVAGAPNADHAPPSPEAGAPRRRVSATRDLSEAPVASTSEVPALFDPTTLPTVEPQATTWQDCLQLALTASGATKDDWQGPASMHTLRLSLSEARTWRQVMDCLSDKGITHADLIPTLAVAEARGWVAITSSLPEQSLDLAAFLRDTGLLSVDQVASLITDSQAFRDCRFDALCKELVGKKMLSLAKAGFLNRLGRLAQWHVVPATTFATADAG